MTNQHDISLPGGENAVLLIHGLTGSPYELKHVALRLNRAGFTVKVPCLAGHGTTYDDLARTRWQDWYGTVAASLDELRQTHASVSVGGLCMGAVLALLLAADAKNQINSLALMSTTLAYDGWATPWYRFLISIVYYTPFRNLAYYSEQEPFGIKNERLRRQVEKGLKENTTGYSRFPCAAMYELLRLAAATKKVMPRVTAPALILHAQEDDLASVKNAEYVEQHIGSEKKIKVLLDDSYHMITMDNQRAQVTEKLIQFFTEMVPKNRTFV